MKPDFKLSDKIVSIMEKENITFAVVAKESGVSYPTVKDYAEKKPVAKWHDTKAVKLGAWVNQYEQKYREKAAEERAKKLQQEAEKNGEEQRKMTIYARAKMVHAILNSPLLTEAEKELYVPQYMS